jgi:flagellar motor switch protein FliN/FliY|tara:strand:- start:311 stop:535 length:225 start_codon:yes stop_codon:yes gene_type:complete
LSGVNVRLTAILGGTELTFDEAVELDPDTLITVDRSQDEPVDLCVNGKVVARGKLVVVGDTYGVQVTELVDSKA